MIVLHAGMWSKRASEPLKGTSLAVADKSTGMPIASPPLASDLPENPTSVEVGAHNFYETAGYCSFPCKNGNAEAFCFDRAEFHVEEIAPVSAHRCCQAGLAHH